MTTEPIYTDELAARLDWMRAEFRTAQQRRYERRHPLVKDVRVAGPKSATKAEPPTVATPSW